MLLRDSWCAITQLNTPTLVLLDQGHRSITLVLHCIFGKAALEHCQSNGNDLHITGTALYHKCHIFLPYLLPIDQKTSSVNLKFCHKLLERTDLRFLDLV